MAKASMSQQGFSSWQRRADLRLGKGRQGGREEAGLRFRADGRAEGQEHLQTGAGVSRPDRSCDGGQDRRGLPLFAHLACCSGCGSFSSWLSASPRHGGGRGNRRFRPALRRANAAVDTRPSLVVLPFDNLSDDKEQEYLANGFTEDLTTELARLPGLFVVSRNAAFAYKDKETNPTEIAAALGVRYLLEGSIRRVGDDMRINAQLIDGSTSGHLWAERFDGKWSDVSRCRTRSSAASRRRSSSAWSAAQGERAGGTDNSAAYDAYLKGMDIYNRTNTPEEFAEAVKHFEQAVQLDPNFGAAFAQLAWAYWEADITRAVVMGLSIDAAYGKVFETLKLASRHPSPAYYQLVAELMVREHNSDEAVTVLLKSVALDPSDPWNYLRLANALNFNGRPKEALSYLDAAARVDPNSWRDWRHYQTGLAEFTQEKFQDAVRSIEKMDFESPDPWAKFYALQVLVSAYAHLGRTEQAASALKRLKEVRARRYGDEPNQLITQNYMVFKNTADIERLLAGLSRAGVPDLPAAKSAGLNTKDRLTGVEIKSLIFGRKTQGRLMFGEFLPIKRTTSADGAVRETVGTKTREGTSWVQGNFLCNAFPEELTSCGAIIALSSGRRVVMTSTRRFTAGNSPSFRSSSEFNRD